jgi:NitT/TauT family transport system ATP-binding protein
MQALEIEGLRKSYQRERQDDLVALRDISFSVDKGQFISVVGPSGCGKTTLLSCIAGLRAKSGGRVMLYGEEVRTPPKAMALIFQEYGRTLLPWRRVLPNVTFGMENRPEIPRGEYEARAREALAHVALAGYADAYPWQLSGGQQQRVAIARGLANGADILLMDEPFASVDAQTRGDLEDLLLRVWEEYSRTILFVTHDIEEAIYMADRVIVLSAPPCVVLQDIPIELARPRNQITTREHPTFLDYRRTIHRLLGLSHG